FLDQCAAAQQNAAVANTRLHDVLANTRLAVGFYTEGVPLKHPDSKDESRYLNDLEYKADFDLKSRWFATARELSALHEKTESILRKHELGAILAIQRGFSEEFSKTMSSLRSTNAGIKQLRHAAMYVAMSPSPYLRGLATRFLSEQLGGIQKLEDLTHKFAAGTPTILHEMVNSDEASLMIYTGK
ncbi:hypothetical protein N9Z54_08235, partial [Planctomycetota bacterium]|nr:hypothetical protein [Planctomycetota bacterium]